MQEFFWRGMQTQNHRLGSTPHSTTCQFGHSDVARILLVNGANLEAMDGAQQPPLFYACRGGDAKAVMVLLGQTANATAEDTDDGTPLHIACQHGFSDSDCIAV